MPSEFSQTFYFKISSKMPTIDLFFNKLKHSYKVSTSNCSLKNYSAKILNNSSNTENTKKKTWNSV